jgi:hypothetical protein
MCSDATTLDQSLPGDVYGDPTATAITPINMACGHGMTCLDNHSDLPRTRHHLPYRKGSRPTWAAARKSSLPRFPAVNSPGVPGGLLLLTEALGAKTLATLQLTGSRPIPFLAELVMQCNVEQSLQPAPGRGIVQ